MKVPVEFKRFARLFMQRDYLDEARPQEAVSTAIGRMDSADVPIAKAYVDSLLDGGLGEEQLDAIWKSCEPHYWVEVGKMRVFLTEVQREFSKVSS
jgi:hypothetical protein